MKVFGGMLLKNLMNHDETFELQMRLFEKGIIDGCQLQLCHPHMIHRADAAKIASLLNELPSGLGVFLHFPGENMGVDVGIRFDERGVFNSYRQQHPRLSWSTFNAQAFTFSRRILEGCNRSIVPHGVVHGGYATQQAYENSPRDVRKCAVQFLEVYGRHIVIETLPPIIRKDWVKGWYCPDLWSSPTMRCFGGTPECMKEHIDRVGASCLIDFSHLLIIASQVAGDYVPGVTDRRLRSYEGVIDAYMSLQHSSVCHFSGIPPAGQLIPTHDYFSQPIPQVAIEAMKTMEVICLEIPWDNCVGDSIARFRDTTGF